LFFVLFLLFCFYFCFSCWLFLLDLPLIHKNVYNFSARFQKMCLPVWGSEKKKVSGPPWPPIVINLIFSSIDSIGHFCHALMHAQHAKYDLERPRLTTWVASQHM
jgi:hypothetical protein